MDAELRQLLTSTVTVRRATASGRYNDAQSFGVAHPFPAYTEQRQRRLYDGAGTVVENYDVIVIDVVDVAASALSSLTRDDFFWAANVDANNFDKGKKPSSLMVYRDPETATISHYEVIL